MDGNNPWFVESIEAFTFLNCPECKFAPQEAFFFQVQLTHETIYHIQNPIQFDDSIIIIGIIHSYHLLFF